MALWAAARGRRRSRRVSSRRSMCWSRSPRLPRFRRRRLRLLGRRLRGRLFFLILLFFLFRLHRSLGLLLHLLRFRGEAELIEHNDVDAAILGPTLRTGVIGDGNRIGVTGHG